jgi:hypothetical protein
VIVAVTGAESFEVRLSLGRYDRSTFPHYLLLNTFKYRETIEHILLHHILKESEKRLKNVLLSPSPSNVGA